MSFVHGIHLKLLAVPIANSIMPIIMMQNGQAKD